MIDLVGALERGLDAKEDNWGTDKLHVSDLAVAIPGPDGKCEQQLALRLAGAKAAEPTPGKKLMFDHGQEIHSRVTSIIEAGLGPQVTIDGIEVSVTGDLESCGIEDVSGTLDLLLCDHERAETVVVDYKTVRGRAFGYMKGPKPANVLQIQTYMLAVEADYGVLLYIDREGQNFARQYKVERDDEAVRAAAAHAQAIQSGTRKPHRQLPVLNWNKEGGGTVKAKMPWQCGYCEYYAVSCSGALYGEPEGVVGTLDIPGRTLVHKEGLPEELAEALRAHFFGTEAKGGLYEFDPEVGF